MKRKKISFLAITFTLLFAQSVQIYAQKKPIELKEIWASRVFSPEMAFGIQPLSDANHYAVIDKEALNTYDFQSGQLVRSIVKLNELRVDGAEKPLEFRSYELSTDETKILFPTETEPIYRHSTRSYYYIYDIAKKTLIPLSANGKQQLATFSPDGTMIAFARDNNIFVKVLASGEEKQITFDGKQNEIINGSTDWVYEEEFSFTKAFFWSGDSKKIAYYRFDESNVKEFQMTYYNDLYPEQYRYKYPKAGEQNSEISIKIWNVFSNETINVDLGNKKDIYIPRIAWTQDANLLSVQRLNRHQNHFELLLANASNGKSKVLYEETNKYYVDITDDLTFLPDGKHFVISSEKDGFNHLYLYDLTGKIVRQLTTGNYDITKFYGYDKKNKKIYYQSSEISPLERHVFTTDLKGKKKQLTTRSGHNNATFSSGFNYFINVHSSIITPPFITVNSNNGTEIRILKDNSKLKETLSNYSLGQTSFFSFSDSNIVMPDGKQVSLNGYQILPPHFDVNRKYPVLIYIYGGPGSQTVNNAWGGSNYMWFQHLAQKGIIVVSVDNRGTGARGESFKKMTYKELGKYETEDLISTARYVSKLNYVDASNIGVFGWSYGGYMSSLGITKGADYFKAAIAVAPVTNWKYYDNIYTERFMQLPNENSSGYDNNSPINHVEKLKGSYLLIHGSGDDNVHYQNTMEMINALVKANKQFELMIYPNRNHGISGGNTRLHLYEMMTHFLERNLIR